MIAHKDNGRCLGRIMCTEWLLAYEVQLRSIIHASRISAHDRIKDLATVTLRSFSSNLSRRIRLETFGRCNYVINTPVCEP